MTESPEHATPDRATRADDRADVVAEMPSALKRGAIYLVALIVVVAVAILYFGQVYVVVHARGKIVPEGDVVLVEALQGGVVTAVLAKAGDRLPAGAPIMKLDVSESGVGLAELQQRAAVQADQLAKLRATKALIDRILANPAKALQETQRGTDATVGNVMQLVNELENSMAKVDGAKRAAAGWPSQKAGAMHDIEVMRENIAINEKSVASQKRLLAGDEAALTEKQTQIQGYRKLADRKLLSSLELASEEERLRSAEASVAESRRRYEQQVLDISNQKLKLAELEDGLESEPAVRESNRRQAENSFRQTLALLRQEGGNIGIQLREIEGGVRTTDAKLKMAENKISLASVTMPVAGVIAGMKTAGAGELVAAGALVATVVPDGVPLVVEALVPNRDIGFVRPGIDGRIKVDAYPFQQFGTLRARVRTLLPGLGGDENFTVRLELVETKLAGDSRELPLFPGLTVDAELLTTRQRLFHLLAGSPAAARRAQ